MALATPIDNPGQGVYPECETTSAKTECYPYGNYEGKGLEQP